MYPYTNNNYYYYYLNNYYYYLLLLVELNTNDQQAKYFFAHATISSLSIYQPENLLSHCKPQ